MSLLVSTLEQLHACQRDLQVLQQRLHTDAG